MNTLFSQNVQENTSKNASDLWHNNAVSVKEKILLALMGISIVYVLIFALTRIIGISFVDGPLNNWALVIAGLAAIGGFVVSWFLPYRGARVINGIFSIYILSILIAWAGCGSCYKTVVKQEIIATIDSPGGDRTAVAYKNGAVGQLDLNVRVTVETRFFNAFKITRHLTYEYGAGDVVLFWLDNDSLVAVFGPDKIYSRRWDFDE